MSTPSTTAAVRSVTALSRMQSLVCLATGAVLASFYIGCHVRYGARFGTGALANVTALSSALLGIAFGATAAPRLRPSRPELTIATLFGAVALLAVASPWIVAALAGVDRVLLGNAAETPGSGWPLIVMQSAVAVLVYAPPGAAIAIMLVLSVEAGASTNERRSELSAGHAIGLVGIGAAAAALVAMLAIVPIAGFTASLWLAAAVCVAMAGMLLQGARGLTARVADTTPGFQAQPGAMPTTVTASGMLKVSRPARARGADKSNAPQTVGRLGRACMHTAAFTAGAAAIAGHYLWYRVIAHADAVAPSSSLEMLTAAFAGLGAGALLGRRLVGTRLGLGVSLAALNLAAAVATALVFLQALTWLAPLEQAPWLKLAWPVVQMLPPAVLGASLAILAELGTANARSAAHVASVAIAFVAIGGAAGGVIAWLWLLPHGGFGLLITCVTLTYVAGALLMLPFIAARGRVATSVAAALIAVTAIGLSFGRPTVAAIDPTADVIAVSRPVERYYAAGRTRAVRVIEYQGRFIVQVDGTEVDSVPVRGSAPTQNARQWLATLPVTARPDARSFLALGLDGGVMLEGIPQSIAHVDVVEAEDAIVAANRVIATERVVDPLAQPRITLIDNDPRRALRLTSERYDIVVSQLAAVRGAAAEPALSREFLAELREHLADGGIVAQLLDGAAVDSRLARATAATLRATFAHVRLYEPEADALIFLASALPIEPELQLARTGAPITGEIMHYSRMGMNGVEDLLAALVADGTGIEALAQDANAQSDDSLRIDDRAAQAPANTTLAAVDPLRQRDSWAYADLADTANFAYLARRLIAQNKQARALAVSEVHPDESTRLTIVGLLHDSRGDREQAIAAYEAALNRRTDNAEARFLLLGPSIPLLAQDAAPPALAALADELPASAAALIAARRAGAAQDWGAIADLDGALGATSVTDAWYPEVVFARAEWRSRANQNVERLAFDALRLIDRAVVIEPERNYFLLRAAIGIATNDGNLAVESSRNIVRLIAQLIENAAEGDGRIESRQVEIIRQNLNAITMNMRGEIVANNERRAEEVRQSASLILRYLDTALVQREQ